MGHRFRTVVGVGAGLALAAAAGGGVAVGLPAPGGPHPVGTATYFLVDAERQPPVGAGGRSLTVQAWYPAEAGASVPAPYVSSWEVLEDLAETGYYDQPAERIASWREVATHAGANARPRTSPSGHPLVLFSVGLGIVRANYTTLAESLASYGYLVLVVDHPHGATTRDAAGRLLRLVDDTGFREDEATSRRYEAQWAADLRFILDWLADRRPAVAAAADLERVAAVGHSLGGAAAFEACRTDRRIRACINLDGFSFGAARQEGVGAPAMLVKAEPDYSDEDLAARGRTRADWNAMIARVRPQLLEPLASHRGHASYFVAIERTGHLSFTDAPFVMPDTISRFGGTQLAPERSLEVVDAVLRAFLDERLRGRRGALLEVADALPEVTVETVRGGDG